MPNTRGTQTVYLHTGNPDTVNEQTPFRPGEIGQTYQANDRAYQIVDLDSGATASPASGVVAANQLAYWKDKSKYLVTNDQSQAIGGVASGTTGGYRNNVAGIFRTAVTAGYRCFVLHSGRSIAVKSDSNGAIGDNLISDTSASRATNVAVGTAVTHQALGTVVAVAAGGNITADVDIQPIP